MHLSDTPRTDAMMMASGGALDWLEHLRRTEHFARQLERDLTAAQKDAERYRWLRSGNSTHCKAGIWIPSPTGSGEDHWPDEKDANALIDAAIAAEKSTKGE